MAEATRQKSGESIRSRVCVSSRELGKGAFGVVYAAEWRDRNGGPLAVKIVRQDGLSEKARAQLRREVALHASIVHETILRCHGAYEGSSPGTLHLVLDQCAGDVASALRCGAAAAVRVLAPRLMRSLICALRHLHDDDVAVVHADVKSSNLLLTSDGCLRLCDLGAAARVHIGCGRSTLVGSPAYLAPEVVAVRFAPPPE